MTESLNSDERSTLEAFVDDQRSELIETLLGLTEEQARRRLVPSLTTPIGLVKHGAFVERVWFQASLLGRTREEIGIPYDVDPSFVVGDDETVDSVIADFRAAIAESKTAVASYELDDQALHNRRGPVSIRWIYAHLIREYARHAGHGDILREQILAADGD